MNANRLLDMALRFFLRKAINKSVDVGVEKVFRDQSDTGSEIGTAARKRQTKAQARRAKQSIRAARRLGRL